MRRQALSVFSPDFIGAVLEPLAGAVVATLSSWEEKG
jgi:hypothetical protein